MTLIIAVSISDDIILVSDQRLTAGRTVVSDKTVKSGSVSVHGSRLVTGFCGIASVGKTFRTVDFLVEANIDFVSKATTENHLIQQYTDFLKQNISAAFRNNPALRSLTGRSDALYVLVCGYDQTGKSQYGIVANRPALDQLGANFQRGEFRSCVGDFPNHPVVIGQERSVSKSDLDELNDMALGRKSRNAIVAKATDIIRAASLNLRSDGTVGERVTVLILPRAFDQTVEVGDSPTIETNEITLPNQTLAIKGNTMAVKGITLTSHPSRPFMSPASRNSRCPCGSGKKFKHCHENNSEPATGWSFEILDFKPSKVP